MFSSLEKVAWEGCNGTSETVKKKEASFLWGQNGCLIYPRYVARLDWNWTKRQET